MIPILTGVVVVIPLLFMGSLIAESFFGIPGLGSYTIDAIKSQDFAVVRAMVFLGSVLYIVGLILTDISYTLVDPRVRLRLDADPARHPLDRLRWSSCWSRWSPRFVWYVRRHEHLRAPWRRVAQTPSGMSALVVLAGVRRRSACSTRCTTARALRRQRRRGQGAIMRSRCCSVLDARRSSRCARGSEKTYSAPLATHALREGDGRAARRQRRCASYPRLKFGGAHLDGPGARLGRRYRAARALRRVPPAWSSWLVLATLLVRG